MNWFENLVNQINNVMWNQNLLGRVISDKWNIFYI